jgi:hypothetical protein
MATAQSCWSMLESHARFRSDALVLLMVLAAFEGILKGQASSQLR